MVVSVIGPSQILAMLVVFFFLALGAGILFLIFSLARYLWRKSSSNDGT